MSQELTRKKCQEINAMIPEDVMKRVEEELDERFKDYPKGLGFCHTYWGNKRALLKEQGYEWFSPQDIDDLDPAVFSNYD